MAWGVLACLVLLGSASALHIPQEKLDAGEGVSAMYLSHMRGGAHRLDVNDPEVIMAAQFIAAQYAKSKKSPSDSFDVQRISYAERQPITQDVVQFVVQMDLADASSLGMFRVVGVCNEEFGNGYTLVSVENTK